MRKIYFYSFLSVILYSANAKAQLFDNTVYNRKSLYAEVYGTGLGATLNYEYLFNDNVVKKGIRGGAGYFANFLEENSPNIISGNLEYVSFGGARDHHLEWGLGLAYQYKYYKKVYQIENAVVTGTDTTIFYESHDYKYTRTGPAVVPRIGYRYESPDGGMVLRIAYTPLIYLINKEKEFLDGSNFSTNSIPFATKFAWGGVSIGFSFY